MRGLVRRVIQLVVVVVVVTFFTSALLEFLPGDLCKTAQPFATESQRQDCRDDNHLDDNVVVRYGKWFGGFATGDMGGFYTGAGLKPDPVFDRVKRAMPRSLTVMFWTQLFTLLIAIPLGVLMAFRAGSRIDRGVTNATFALVAVPAFVLAVILKLQLGVKWGTFDTLGYDGFFGWRKLGLPVITLCVGQIAVYARLLRSDMVATLQEDFILMAKSKGISSRRILWVHALRPSSLTLLTVAGLNVGTLVGGALIVERIFDIGGIGTIIFGSIQQRQVVALQSCVALVAIIYVVINFFVDTLYRVLDPRIRNV